MNPNAVSKKPLRARKTMTPSCRKQVETLNKIKCLQGLENVFPSENNHVPLRLHETNVFKPNHREEINPNPESRNAQLLPPILKSPITELVVNSEINIYNDNQIVSKDHPYNADNTHTNVEQYLNAEALQDMLYKLYENESSSPLPKPVEVCLNSEASSSLRNQLKSLPPSINSPTSQIPVLDKIGGTPGETFTNQTIPVLELNDDNWQKGKVNSSLLADDVQRKRGPSESSQSAHCKRVRTAEACDRCSERKQSGLEKVKRFIQGQLDAAVGDLDHNLQRLNERVTRTQCLRKHEGIAIKIVKKISKLHRRVNTIFQAPQLTKKTHIPGAHSQNESVNLPPSLPVNVNGPSVSLKPTPLSRSESPSKATASCPGPVCEGLGSGARNKPGFPHKPSSDQTGVKNKIPDEKVVNDADVLRKDAVMKADLPAKTACSVTSECLIDLTEEERGSPSEVEKSVLDQTSSAPESLQANRLQHRVQSLSQVAEQFPHLPPLPRIRLHPGHMDRFRETLPPQKLELAAAHVQNPKGIALQWDIRDVNPRCAAIESFHLFVCLESANGSPPSAWIKTSKIQAFPLPMACSLTPFSSAGKCYFTMQSKDIYGRYGPYCDIQAISSV